MAGLAALSMLHQLPLCEKSESLLSTGNPVEILLNMRGNFKQLCAQALQPSHLPNSTIKNHDWRCNSNNNKKLQHKTSIVYLLLIFKLLS